jgi:hypothetical protein
MIEILEGRTLFSVSVTVQADIDAVNADKFTLASDRTARAAAIAADKSAITVDTRAISAAVAAAKLSIRTTLAQEKAQLQSDQRTGPATLASDSATVKGDEAALRAAKATGDADAIASAQLTLTTDEGTLKTDQSEAALAVVTDKTAIIATTRGEGNMIREASLTATAVATAARQKLAADELSYDHIVAVQTAQLATDQAKLITDERNHA